MVHRYIHSGPRYSETRCLLRRRVLEQQLSGRSTWSFIKPPTERWKTTSSSVSEVIMNINLTEVIMGCRFCLGKDAAFQTSHAEKLQKGRRDV